MMEYCEVYSEIKEKEIFDKCEKNCFENLKTMHQLKIVHRDIKEKNIGWSPSLKKWVFLDFGFTTCLEENFGEQTKTEFIGTIGYTLNELK